MKKVDEFLRIKPRTLQCCSQQEAVSVKGWIAEIRGIASKRGRMTELDKSRVEYLSKCLNKLEEKYAKQSSRGTTAEEQATDAKGG